MLASMRGRNGFSTDGVIGPQALREAENGGVLVVIDESGLSASRSALDGG